MTVSPGTRLGRYEIRSKIGAGGMGEVYAAYDSKLKRQVAIKILPAAFSADKDRIARFEQEAQAASALNHPNILSVFDFGEHEGETYVVSELLEGGSLREHLRDGPIPRRRAIDHASQIARGLMAAHARGIVHRDLKPENIFITNDGQAKILDFGLAKLIEPTAADVAQTDIATRRVHTSAGTVLGTIGYMSPEQVRAQPVDHRSDIFSFGAVLYEMFSGKRAFQGASAVETMNAILKEDPPELSATNQNVPPAIERIIQHCLEKSVGERFQSARDLGFALEALSGGTVKTTAEQVVMPARSRRLWVPAGIVVALAAMLAAGIFVGKSLSKSSPPSYQQLTFRRGSISSARFAPDGQTIIYSAAWQGKPIEIFSTRPESPESRPLGLPETDILAISSTGELAIQLMSKGTLARMPLGGGAPRELLDRVTFADWSPDGSNLAVVRRVERQLRLEFPIGHVLYEPAFSIIYPRVSPKGDMITFLEVPAQHSRSLSLVTVDLAGKKKILTGEAGFGGLAWSADGNEVWFTRSEVKGSTTLYAVSLAGTQRLIARLAGNFTLQDISRQGRLLLSRDNRRTEIVGLAPEQTKESDLSWLDSSNVSDVSNDGRMLLITEDGEGGGPNRSIYWRKTDGSPAVRLGNGGAFGLSPDEKFVLQFLDTAPQQLFLLPIGAGEPRLLQTDPISTYTMAQLFPDGKRILIAGSEPGKGVRCYVQDLAGGSPRAITPEGIGVKVCGKLISPDGKFVVAFAPDGKVTLYPVDGGEPRSLSGITPAEIPIRWSGDGRSLFIFRRGEMPAKLYRFDVLTQQKELLKELIPSDPAGVSLNNFVALTPDGNFYAYTYERTLSDLYLVEGLK